MTSQADRRQLSLLKWTAPFLAVALATCTPAAKEAEPELAPATQESGGSGDKSDAEIILAAIDRQTGGSGNQADAVQDVRLILKATALEAGGSLEEAVKVWFEAQTLARGKFARKAFVGWCSSYVRALGKRMDSLVLARLLLAESQGGTRSPYLQENGLTSDSDLAKALTAIVPEWLTAGPEAAETPVPPPAVKGLPPEDPLLTKAAAISCGGKVLKTDAWISWVAGLSPPVKTYWEGLIAQCAGQTGDAITRLQDAYPKLGSNAQTRALAIEAAGRVAAMQRSGGMRESAADTYKELMGLWMAKGQVSPEKFGLDALALIIRRADESLMAANYRALVGDYESAKIYAHDAINQLSNAYAVKTTMTPEIQQQLAARKAEAYHVLAFRVAVENKEYEQAASLMVVGLQSQHLDVTWRERLAWFGGFYEYLAGNYDTARRRWEALLAATKTDDVKASVYFWLARTLDKLGQKDESRFYISTLMTEYPTSYYATVAPEAAGMPEAKRWQTVFGEPAALAGQLRQKRDFELAPLRANREMARSLARAEILVNARAGELARLAVTELDDQMSASLLPEHNAAPLVYLSRLHSLSGNWLRSIELTTKVAKANPGLWRQFPEQLLVYFPRPYFDLYESNALETSVEREVLLGVSRRESGFMPGLRSGANAIGVMQLIRPTAERFAAEAGLPVDDMERRLTIPGANIKIASRYLKWLQLNYKGFSPAILGAYNAGDYAMDRWLKRRGHTDPLVFVELIPFGETKEYVKAVWRNVVVYRYISGSPVSLMSGLTGPAVLGDDAAPSRPGARDPEDLEGSRKRPD